MAKFTTVAIERSYRAQLSGSPYIDPHCGLDVLEMSIHICITFKRPGQRTTCMEDHYSISERSPLYEMLPDDIERALGKQRDRAFFAFDRLCQTSPKRLKKG